MGLWIAPIVPSHLQRALGTLMEPLPRPRQLGVRTMVWGTPPLRISALRSQAGPRRPTGSVPALVSSRAEALRR